MERKKIAEILLNYKTDKNFGTIKNIYDDLYNWVIIDNPEECIGHSYGESYDEIFENFDYNDNINFLEIGIQKGGSLVAWRDYFPNANIFGIDIVDCVIDEYRRKDFNYIISDIKDDSLKEKFKNIMFDIIIDDGSHYLSDTLFIVNNYLEKLNKNGYLIIEDCQQPEQWLQVIKNKLSNEYELTFKDLRRHTPFSSYDNFLIIIKRK
jgi:23S rRNA U2552 (ribose-2'-O)-methylase RlmE/FtsJ